MGAPSESNYEAALSCQCTVWRTTFWRNSTDPDLDPTRRGRTPTLGGAQTVGDARAAAAFVRMDVRLSLLTVLNVCTVDTPTEGDHRHRHQLRSRWCNPGRRPGSLAAHPRFRGIRLRACLNMYSGRADTSTSRVLCGGPRNSHRRQRVVSGVPPPASGKSYQRTTKGGVRTPPPSGKKAARPLAPGGAPCLVLPRGRTRSGAHGGARTAARE